MDENTNFPQNSGESQPQPQPFQQQLSANQPPDSISGGDFDGGGSKRWLGWLSLAVLLVAVLYFSGFWGWIGGLIPEAGDKIVGDEDQLKEEVGKEDSHNLVMDESAAAGLVTAEKGNVSLVVSAGVERGSVLVKGDSQPNVEIRKVYMHNTAKDSWVLVYDGFRPLDLNLLGATGEKHELIATTLAAVEYDRLKVEFTDLVSIDQKGEQTVARTRTVELASPIVVKGGANQLVNVWFDISDANEPKPAAVLQ